LLLLLVTYAPRCFDDGYVNVQTTRQDKDKWVCYIYFFQNTTKHGI